MTIAARLAPLTKKHYHGKKVFFLGVGISFLFFIPFLIMDNGLFLYYGDFNVQQIPFYQMIHDSIRSGNLGWSSTTDLGANIIGSYSFYMISSPFFWLTLPFPSEFVPYMMAPLLMLKTGLSALAGYVYLKRYVRNKNFAVLGGLLYALSGFAIYNIFFNHFHEAMIVFPFLLAALDEFIETKRRGVLAIATFAACFINYYFFVGQVVFIIIYWFVRMLTYSYKLSLKELGVMLFEVALGMLTTSVVLLPSVLVVSQNNRVDNTIYGWNTLVYQSSQRYLDILKSFFFPQDIPAYPNFTPDSNAKWSSLSAWLPLFGCTGVIAFLQYQKRQHWLKKLIPILVLMAFVPVLNSIFQLFNSQYYARWFYMLILLMVLATIMALENSKTDWKRALTWSGGITAGIAFLIGFTPNGTEEENRHTIGLMEYPDRFWIYVAISIIGLAMLSALLILLKKDKKKFMRFTTLAVAVVVVSYSLYALGLGKSRGYSTHDYLIPYVINQEDNIDVPDKKNVRSDFYNAMDNSGMFWQIPTIQAFHSIVPASVMDFYPSIGVTRDVGSRPDTSVYGLRSFTSTRWLFDWSGNGDKFAEEDGTTKMPGWEYYGQQNNFNVYENEYFIPMGFTYDSFITDNEYEDSHEGNRHLLLLKAMVLTQEQQEKYSSIVNGKNSSYSSFRYTEEEYFNDCTSRGETACSYFAYDNKGFSAKIDMSGKDENLVFFSVPYEDGWSATVNGEAVDIEKVNVGFMAVRVPGGAECDIRFDYHTPGLTAGLMLTLAGVIIFAVYMLLVGNKKNKEIKVRVFEAVKEDDLNALQAGNTEIETEAVDNQDYLEE